MGDTILQSQLLTHRSLARKSLASQEYSGHYGRAGGSRTKSRGHFPPLSMVTREATYTRSKNCGPGLPLCSWEALSHLRKLPKVRTSPRGAQETSGRYRGAKWGAVRHSGPRKHNHKTVSQAQEPKLQAGSQTPARPATRSPSPAD